MNRKYRRALWTGAAVLLAGVLVFLGAAAFIGSDWAKQYLMQKLESASGQRLHAEKLVLQLRPGLRIDATQFRLSKPDGNRADSDFLRAESASFRIALLPLLLGRIRLDNAEMEGVQLFPQRVRAADERHTLRLSLRAGNLSDFGKSGARTSFAIHAEVEGMDRGAAGNIHAEGVIGLGADLAGTDLRAHIDAPAKSPLLNLIGLGGRDLAAFQLDLAVHERAGSVEIAQLAFSLGALQVAGQGLVHVRQSPLRIEGRLRTDSLDWEQTMRDAGLPPLPPKPAGALFRDRPLAWPLLQQVRGFTADLGLQLGVLRLRSGVPLQNVKMQLQLQEDQMRISALSADFMGGKATADAVFTAHDRQVRLNLKASGVSVEQWRNVLHKPARLKGGLLAVDAKIVASGASTQKLADTLTGPVDLRMARAVVFSSGASEVEFLLTGLVPALAGKRAERMEVICAVARLPFEKGRARAAPIAGARTESSQLLTDGEVDLHDHTLNLHGRVTGVGGVRLGASMFVGDVNISGKLVRPRFRLDSRGLLGTAARVGAAILSGGLTAVGATLWDANADDACKVGR
jgi:uncharacterized protein involved in outer membrane biogenesis